MDGIPPALPSDSEDVAWALETAESLWKRGERVDAVVWVRRAAQAAGEGEDAKRAAALARSAAELGDWIGSHTITGQAIEGRAQSERSLEALDALLGDPPLIPKEGSDAFVLSTRDVEVVSAKDFEAGFGAPPPRSAEPKPSAPPPGASSESEVMTVSLHAPDVEIIEEGVTSEEFPEEEPTPIRQPRSPVPDPNVPSAAAVHAGMLDPWAEAEVAKKNAERASAGRISRTGGFEEEEVVTSAKRNDARPPLAEADGEQIPRAPKAPRFPAPRGRAPSQPAAEEAETTTYRQISPRSPRLDRPSAEAPDARAEPAPEPKPIPRGPLGKPRPPVPEKPSTPVAAKAPTAKPPLPPRPEPSRAPSPRPAPPPPPPTKKPAPLATGGKSAPPELDLLEMVDSVSVLPDEPAPITAMSPGAGVSTGPGTAASSRPTAPPPGSMPREALPSAVPPREAMPSAAPTRPRAGKTLLDLGSIEALADLPDDAREDFALAATTHAIARDEEVSHFALALVIDGEIDVSATIVDAPALRLEKNSVLRSRGTIVPGVALRLVCASEKALVATWDDAAVEAAFRTCPWVEEDLRAVADRVQAKAGVTMGPLGERFDQSLREHLLGKLTVRALAPGEVIVAQGKPTPLAVVGIGEIFITKDGARAASLGPGDLMFPSQVLAHASAPATAAAGPAGAVILYGDRAVAQELLMTFPPFLEVLATL